MPLKTKISAKESNGSLREGTSLYFLPVFLLLRCPHRQEGGKKKRSFTCWVPEAGLGGQVQRQRVARERQRQHQRVGQLPEEADGYEGVARAAQGGHLSGWVHRRRKEKGGKGGEKGKSLVKERDSLEKEWQEGKQG